MESSANLLLLLVILLNFFILGSSRLGACIRTAALQGSMLAFVPLLMHPISGHTLFLAVSALALKGFFMPWLLFRAIRQVQIRREIEPMIGYVPTLILGTMATAGAFIFGDHLPLIEAHRGTLVIPCGLATLATGFLMLITRRKALTQALARRPTTAPTACRLRKYIGSPKRSCDRMALALLELSDVHCST